MKNKNNIQDNKNYELKTEYIDDLVLKLNKERPKNRKWIYLLSVLLLFVTGAVLLYPGKSQQNNELSKKNELTLVSENKSSTIKSVDDKSNFIIPNNSTNELKTLSEKKENKIDETDNSIKPKKEKNKKTTPIQVNELRTKKEIKSVDEKKLATEKSITKGEENSLNTINYENINRSEDSRNNLNVSVQEINNIDKKIVDTNEIKFITKNLEKKDSIYIEPSNILDSNTQDNFIDSSKIEKKESIPNDTLAIVDTANLVSKPDSISIKNNETPSVKNNWQLSLLVGSNISFSHFSNSTNQDYASIRKDQENYLMSLSGGVNFEKFVSNNVKITTGLNYISYGSNNNYTPVNSFKNSSQFNGFDSVYTTKIDSIFYNPTRMWLPYSNGIDTTLDSAFVNNQIAYDDSVAYLSNGKVSFSYIEIPLMIGYYKTINKWNFGVNSGVGLGLLTQSSGYYIGEDLKTISVAKSQKLMWNFILGPEINYSFSDSYYLGIQSNMRLGLNNISISEPIERKYYSIQFNAKIGYKF